MTDVSIELDFFPANVYTPEGSRFESVRLILADGYVQVYGATAAGIVKVYERPYQSWEGNRIAGYSILTSEGNVVGNPAGGCGCGSPLRSFDPFSGMRRVVPPRV